MTPGTHPLVFIYKVVKYVNARKGQFIDPNLRFSFDEILSYQRFLNIIYSSRGLGKTYKVKTWGTSRFEKFEERFIYLRRYDTDLINMKGFFDDLSGEDEEKKEHWKVRSKGDERLFLYDGEIGGYFGSFTSLAHTRSVSFSGVVNVFFDEFMAGLGQRYRKDEFNEFLSIIDTLNRYTCDNMRIFLLGNNVTLYNPYFLELGYTGSHAGEFWAPVRKGPLKPGECGYKYDTVIQRVEPNGELLDAFKNSRFGRFIEGSEYANHSLYNKTLTENYDFIGKKSGDSYPMFNFLVDKIFYSVWCSSKTGRFFVCNGKVNDVVTYSSGGNDGFSEGTFNINALKLNGKYKYFVNAYNTGYLYFENLRCKSAALKIMRDVMRL